MIRYHEMVNAWVSGKNADEQGMPSTDLRGDQNVCSCTDCHIAKIERRGSNIDSLPSPLL